MSKIYPVTLQEFNIMLEEAQKTHLVRDEPLPQLQQSKIDCVESSLTTPFQSFNGIQFYKGFVNKAAILFYLVIKNHCLSNGNKRMGILVLAYFFKKNKRKFQITDNQLYDLAKRTSESDPDDKDKTVSYIKQVVGMALHP